MRFDGPSGRRIGQRCSSSSAPRPVATVSQLTTLQSRGWSTADAVLVAILAGLDTQFRWGDEWRTVPPTSIGTHERDYQRLSGERRPNYWHHRDGSQNFDKLYSTWKICQTEADSFFRFHHRRPRPFAMSRLVRLAAVRGRNQNINKILQRHANPATDRTAA